MGQPTHFTENHPSPTNEPYQVLLYYLYTPIDDPASFAIQQRAFCQANGLRGRLIIAHEGVNGTLSGTLPATKEYQAFLRRQPGFAHIDFKQERCHEHTFDKLQVRVRKELVTWRLSDPLYLAHPEANLADGASENHGSSPRLTPLQFYEAMQDEEVLILDGRNGYEYDLGHFRGAIRADVDNTRDFPTWLEHHFRVPKDRPIITYCTGGVRCEKLTAWLQRAGHKHVAQLDGGIIRYAHDPATQGKGFLGLCYVFDRRQAVLINAAGPHICVGRCRHCDAETEQLHNCSNPRCRRQHLVCSSCRNTQQGYCSAACAPPTRSAYPPP